MWSNALLFTVILKKKEVLPDVEGLLSAKMPKGFIASANAEVEVVLNTTEGAPSRRNTKRVRGIYDRFTAHKRAVIACSAMDNGVTKTIRKYNKDLPDRSILKIRFNF